MLNCFLVAILQITQPGQPIGFEHQFRGNGCVRTTIGTLSVGLVGHVIELTYGHNHYHIPLPPYAGTFWVQYELGTDAARVTDTQKPLMPSLHVMVQRPKVSDE